MDSLAVRTLVAAPSGSRGRSLAELAELAARIGGASGGVELEEACASVAEWATVRDDELARGAEGREPKACDRESPRFRRAHALVELLEESRELREHFAEALSRVLRGCRGLTLFAEGGLPSDRGLIEESGNRLAHRFLPRPRDPGDLARWLTRCFPSAEHADWIASLPPELFRRAWAALAPDTETREHLREALRDALCLLASRVETLGLGDEMRARQSLASVRGSCWHRLVCSTESVSASPGDESALAAWRAELAACRAATREVLGHLESRGVSIALVYSIDAIERALQRMELLHGLLAEREAAVLQRALAELVRLRHADASLLELARDNLRLLARKVVERAGETGEHYITATRGEYAAMWGSALVGGLVTVATAAIKLAVAARHFALGIEGFLAGANYALSFLLIGHVGGTLATKQPSMTGAALAEVVERTRGAERAVELVTLIARIVRSQLAAAFGNVLAVGLGAFAFDRVWLAWRGAHFLDAEAVEYVLHGFHPFASGTILYAALTGAILWASSLIAGTVENWAVYRELPRALADHWLGARLGRARMSAAARFLERHMASWSGSIALGFLLGFAPIAGKFLGLPIDVRHVTLSTGQLALALSELGAGALENPLAAWAVCGIAFTFVLNLAVSFGLALFVALRARGATGVDRSAILAELRRRIALQPLEFLWPPRATRDATRK